MQTLELTPDHQALVERTAKLARDNFTARASHYDATASFPTEDFDDLFEAGLNAPAIPKAYGGFGLGPYRDDVFTLWMMTKELAKVDLSLARCWEGHINSLVLLDGLASESQKARWFEGVVERGEKWVAWSGEPQTRAPGERSRFGTTVQKVTGGYVVDGTKAFSTSAGGAEWAILLVNTAGPGGARHATTSPDTLLLLACDLSDTSVTYDDAWWNPIGMRGTVSHVVQFDQTFIPDHHQIGAPGEYFKGGVANLFHATLCGEFSRRSRGRLHVCARLSDDAKQRGRSLRTTSHWANGNPCRERPSVAASRGPSMAYRAL